MPYGLQIWDGGGNITLDTNWDITRILGVVPQVGLYTTSGTVTDSGFSTGRFFWYFSAKSIGSSYGRAQQATPTVTISGTTMSWSLDMGGYPAQDAGSIIYGVY